MPGAYDQSQEDLAALLGGEPAFRSRQVWDGLYRRVLRPSEMTDLPLALRHSLAAALPPALEPVAERSADDGQTVKWSFRLHDGAEVETVLMHYPGRSTVCVSSQAGCAMACSFCATGQSGFRRHLTSGEILEQVAVAVRAAAAPPALQHRLHGDGRAAGQFRQPVVGGRTHPRRLRARGTQHDGVDGRDHPGYPEARPRRRSRSAWPSRCTLRPRSCATTWCRSTSAIRSPR